MSKETLQIALALIQHPTEDLYLIALRKPDAHLGTSWEFPGGKSLPGEDPAACAVREAHEETGLTVTVLDTWPITHFEYSERTVILHPFLCRADSADARPLENREVRWIAPADLTDYPFPPANAPLLARLQKAPWSSMRGEPERTAPVPSCLPKIGG